VKRGFGGNAPNKLRPMLKVGEVSMQVTHAIGMAKSLFSIKKLNSECVATISKSAVPHCIVIIMVVCGSRFSSMGSDSYLLYTSDSRT
jgi:hypothetical protein